MTNLTSRAEFRVILKGVVSCLKQNLDKPGFPVLTAEEIHFCSTRSRSTTLDSWLLKSMPNVLLLLRPVKLPGIAE
jgi:hypothetical protein